MKRVVTLLAGGTAGHVEPALSVAHWLRNHQPEITCEFVGTKSGIENTLVPEAGFRLRRIRKVPMPRTLSWKLLLWPFQLLVAVAQTFVILNHSSVVVGFGGYVSAPAYLVAKIRGIPIIIHEQNAKPGWANRLGAYLTSNLAIAFESARFTDSRWNQAHFVGMPLRQSIDEIAIKCTEEREQIRLDFCQRNGFHAQAPIVLVFGGSLGARRINDTIAASLSYFKHEGIQVVHSVGAGNQIPPRSDHYLPLEYLANMAELYAVADLVIARCGAVTCSEIAAVADFALLVPLPIGNGEQRANAQELVFNKQAEIVDNSHLTSEWLINNIDRLITEAIAFKNARKPTRPLDSAAAISSIIIAKMSDRSLS
jgi:UDP-N-acetylglucosamine--N-acetylmuramyl-(pentapeptide) pyrophosphoryl-undecaprenol N-acetylglucosamine transferase